MTAALSACGTCVAFAQTEIPALREIHLPVPESRGAFGGAFPGSGVPAHKRFAVRLLPDERLLVMNPNSTGVWSLIRISQWWKDAPEIESLAVPGWAAASVHREGRIETGMLVTPDCGYAVILSGVKEVKDAEHIPFPPDSSIVGKPDTLIVLIDLKRWQVIGSFHTATLGDFDIRRARIAGGRWVALTGPNQNPSHWQDAHIYEWVNLLISIPGLKPGPRCVSKSSESLVVSHNLDPGSAEEDLAQRNNTKCAELLKAVGLTSLYRFDSLMHLGEEPPPEIYQPCKDCPRMFSTGTGPIDERNFNHDNRIIGGERGFTPDTDWLFENNPPFESQAGYWYELQNQAETRTYQLAKYDHAGTALLSRPTTLLAKEGCGQRYRCRCLVADVRDEVNSLLAFCRGYTIEGFDVERWKAQWLTTFRTADLSESGNIRLSKDHYMKQVLATITGASYVLVVDQGETLRVYQVPGATTSVRPSH